VRENQPYNEDDIEWLKAMIAEGIASGVSNKKPETIIEEIIARRHARNRERDLSCR
jgi:antitoxin ParD1/3/4